MAMRHPVAHRAASIAGLPLSYRAAGGRNAPVLLLLHGLPSSLSPMYAPLLNRLPDRYRLVAPDYPGFGYNAAPAPKAEVHILDVGHFALTPRPTRSPHLCMASSDGPIVDKARNASAAPASVVPAAGVTRAGDVMTNAEKQSRPASIHGA